MTIDEAIKDIKDNIKPVVGGKSLDMAIEALERQRWIPCSERLPEDDTEVLVYLFENNKSPYIAWLSDGRWYTEYFEVEREDEPVEWIPLPKYYQKGEQE